MVGDNQQSRIAIWTIETCLHPTRQIPASLNARRPMRTPCRRADVMNSCSWCLAMDMAMAKCTRNGSTRTSVYLNPGKLIPLTADFEVFLKSEKVMFLEELLDPSNRSVGPFHKFL